MQVLKDELRHRIMVEAQHLFLQRGYDRTSLQMIADKVNISKSNLYHYFENKQALFYELTDGAAEGIKRLVMRFRDSRFDPQRGAREYRVLLTEEITSLLLAEKYGLLLIMEQAAGTRHEGLRASLLEIIASKAAPLVADMHNRELLARIMAQNLLGGAMQILKSPLRPRDVRASILLLAQYHMEGIHALGE